MAKSIEEREKADQDAAAQLEAHGGEEEKSTDQEIDPDELQDVVDRGTMYMSLADKELLLKYRDQIENAAQETGTNAVKLHRGPILGVAVSSVTKQPVMWYLVPEDTGFVWIKMEALKIGALTQLASLRGNIAVWWSDAAARAKPTKYKAEVQSYDDESQFSAVYYSCDNTTEALCLHNLQLEEEDGQRVMWIREEHDGVQLDHESLVEQLPSKRPKAIVAHPAQKSTRDKTEKNYEVAKILDTRKTAQGREYQVNWAPCHDNGFRDDEITWEKAENLNCDKMIKQFHDEDHYSDSEASSQASADSAIAQGTAEPEPPLVDAGPKRCRKQTQLFNPQLDGANDTIRRGGGPAKKNKRKTPPPFEVDMVESDMLPSGNW